MNDEEMRNTLVETLELQSKNAQFRKRRPADAHLSPPVSEEELRALDTHLASQGLSAPPSYRQFLLISNGIADYMQLSRLSLRSARQVVEEYESDEEYEDFAPLHEFVISTGNTSDFLAFDRRTLTSDGEMAVVLVNGRGETTDYANFCTFLSEQRTFQSDVWEVNSADRDNLPDN